MTVWSFPSTPYSALIRECSQAAAARAIELRDETDGDEGMRRERRRVKYRRLTRHLIFVLSPLG